MLKDWRKKLNRTPSEKKREPKDKKSFWSYFFEPVPEDEDDLDFFDTDDFDEGRQYGEPPERDAQSLRFNPDELAFSPQDDVAAAERLRWENGETVVPSIGIPVATVSEDFGAYRHPGNRLDGTAPAPQADSIASHAIPVITDNPYVPLGMSIVPVLDAATGLPIPPAFDPMTGERIVPKFDPLTGKPLAQQTVDAAFPADSDIGEEADADAHDEEIRLFDEVGDAIDARSAEKGQTTRLFRTGTGATTRIHINETEDAIRMEEAAKRARAREAREKHDAAMERKNKRKKRSTILRKLFANVAFVLFFIVAVVVALYYGFLLSDIVVLGNETYSSDYIIELSGLQKGRHMLLCDLDEAAQNIRQDPYLQVEQVNYIFPSRIRIVVKERKEVAGIIGLDYNVIIDDQGYVLSMSGGTDLSGLLQVTGVSMTGFQLGQQLGEGNDLGTATLVQIISKLEEYDLMGSVKSIDMTTPLAITFTAKNGLNVHLGQASDLDNKMSTFSRLLPQFISQNIYQGTLYLSAKGGTVYSPPGAQGDVSANAADTAPVTNPTDLGTLPADQGAALPEGSEPGEGTTGEGTPTPDEGTPDATPAATPTAPPTPTPYNPAGPSDEFQG